MSSQAASRGKEHPAEKLRGEFCLQTQQTAPRAYKIVCFLVFTLFFREMVRIRFCGMLRETGTALQLPASEASPHGARIRIGGEAIRVIACAGVNEPHRAWSPTWNCPCRLTRCPERSSLRSTTYYPTLLALGTELDGHSRGPPLLEGL